MNVKYRKEWFFEKIKRNWFWIGSTVVVIAGLIIIPLLADENKQAVEEVTKAFNGKPLKSDNNIQGISIFLPQGFTIESEERNNFVLTKGSQQFLVFINPNEKKTSEQLYQNCLDTNAKFTINETFKDDSRFGFLLTEEVDDKIEVTVGVGGMKLTTITTRSDLASDARNMMRIVNSIEILE